MPLFKGKLFNFPPSRKKKSQRDKVRRDLKNEPLVLKLGSNELTFESGEWKPLNKENEDVKKELEEARRISQELKEENNLLRIKVEVLLDMLTLETTKALEKAQI